MSDNTNNNTCQNLFFKNFLDEMQKAGYPADKMSRYVWKPFSPEELKITGPERDRDFKKLEVKPEEIENYLHTANSSNTHDSSGFADLFQSRKLALVIFPGFMHHMQRFPVFIDKKELAGTAADIIKLSLYNDNNNVKEEVVQKGTGIKVAYVKYPRSNAASETILEKGFNIINNSATLKRWIVDEGRKLIFIGFSYGAPLILETLAMINTGAFKNDYILPNTKAFIAINGAMGGSYLADTLLNQNALINAEKFKNIMNTFKPAGWPLMIKTREEREDLPAGLRSLGRDQRKKHTDWYTDKVPAHIKYYSICSVLPLKDYTKRPWNNFDGLSMLAQSLICNKHTIYNDGQLALHDSMLPDFPHVDDQNKTDLGAVRSHHWGVGYRTMNLGHTKYPRLPFYKALSRTLQ